MKTSHPTTAIPEPPKAQRGDVALSLMKMALGLLDREGGDASIITCHLQDAIDLRIAANESREFDSARSDDG